MGPNVSREIRPDPSLSVVIASGNPGPGFLAPDYSPLLSATLPAESGLAADH